MNDPGSRSEYTQRMHGVLDYIDRHLDKSLELSVLANVAHFSPYHFHRLFKAWFGQTLGDYLRRRRLELAAMRLSSQPRLPVLQAALAVGFGSAEAFSRAFRLHFGSPPTMWRRDHARQRRHKSNLNQVDSKASQAGCEARGQAVVSKPTTVESPVKVTLSHRQLVTIAYLRHLGPYGEPLSQFWQRTYYPWAHTHQLLRAPRYGISHDDPSVTAPENFRYDAGAEVPGDFVATGLAVKAVIPGGQYAAMQFQGPVADIGAAWDRLLRDWLPSSGLQLDARPCFEYYPVDAAFNAKTGVFSCELCIPVVPL